MASRLRVFDWIYHMTTHSRIRLSSWLAQRWENLSRPTPKYSNQGRKLGQNKSVAVLVILPVFVNRALRIDKVILRQVEVFSVA